MSSEENLSKFSVSYCKDFKVTDSIKSIFDEFGFVIVKKLFSEEEINKVTNFFETNEEIKANAFRRDDGKEKKTKVSLWNHPGDDIGSMVSRSKRVVHTLRDLLGGHEIYHYHSKLMMKEAEIGGRHVWHQDYGYWYNNGCVYPDMGSVFLALDPCTKENGCLQVLAGSHKMGRIDHGFVQNSDESQRGDAVQRGADLQRVEWAKQFCPLVFCELSPGDAIYFHCNLLHTSDQNLSNQRRWTMICSFNQARNNPMFESHHPCYTPLDVVTDEDAILKCNIHTTTSAKAFFKPEYNVGDRKV